MRPQHARYDDVIVSRDSALKGQISQSNYEQTVSPIGLKVGMYLSREVLYRKIVMMSSWRHRVIFMIF